VGEKNLGQKERKKRQENVNGMKLGVAAGSTEREEGFKPYTIKKVGGARSRRCLVARRKAARGSIVGEGLALSRPWRGKRSTSFKDK